MRAAIRGGRPWLARTGVALDGLPEAFLALRAPRAECKVMLRF
jgi:hypothetical protein